MPDQVPEISAHRAKDRFGKIAVHTAHEISRALTESGETDDGVVVLRTDGPHRSLAGLERLIDDVLAEEDTGPDPVAPEPRPDDDSQHRGR